MLRAILTLVWLVVAGLAFAGGLEYYRIPLGERAWSELHALYSPAGTVGHGFGVVGTAMIAVGVAGYMIRKRWLAPARFGKLRHWLDVHIFLCTLGAFLVLLHTSFKVGGAVAIAFWSMTAVVLSGFFGRYVYVWIPKTMNGRFLTVQAIQVDLEEVTASMREAVGERHSDFTALLEATRPRVPKRFADALVLSAAHRLGRHARRRRVERGLADLGIDRGRRRKILGLAERRSRIEQQIVLLRPLQRLFRWWHAFHLPLAIVMFLVLLVHVAVAIAFGYTWIF